VNRRLLPLYPRKWRERYGSEVAELADELVAAGETTPLRATLGLLAGAAAERWRVATSRAVLVPAAAAAAVAGGIALAVTRTLHGAGETRPYFDAHPVGLLLPVLELGWVLMEAGEFVRGRRSRHWQDLAAGTGRRSYWPVATLLPLALVVWCIRAEENALLAALGDRYRRYASGHRRLVPLIW
jgi:protein-S-isoprenylcysteine O-methyltransferase Ste14